MEEYKGRYQILINYLYTIWDDSDELSLDKMHIIIDQLEIAFSVDDLVNAELLILDVEPIGLPWPEEPEFLDISNHTHFESFKKILNFINEEIIQDDTFEW
jgi:D-ribose pyranose/furanose isomerase RbsD